MTEMNQALRAIGNLPSNVIDHYPNGRWGFVGSVDYRLRYERADGGGTPTIEQVDRALDYSVRALGEKVEGLRRRSWATREEALAEARRLGVQVSG